MNITMDLYTLSRAYGSGYADDALTNDLPLPKEFNREDFQALLYGDSTGLEVVYTNPKTLRRYLIAYGKSRLDSWQRMVNALNLDYEVIHNYDRTEETTTTTTANTKSTATGTSDSASQSQDITNTMGDKDNPAVTTSYTNAYDSAEEVLNGHTEAVAGKNKASTTNDSHGTMDSSTSGTTDSNGTTTLKTRAYGNIGVTTSQKMLSDELTIRKFNNILQQIVDEYINKACIMVW